MAEQNVVFYSWTYAQIVNMTNLKLNIYGEKKGHMYIAIMEKTERYQYFLDKLAEKAVFETIKHFNYDEMDSYHGEIWKKGIQEKYISDLFCNDFGRGDSVEFVCAGFWMDTLMILKILMKLYKRVQIHLIDEGGAVLKTEKKYQYAGLSIPMRVALGGLFYRRFENMIVDYYVYFKRKNGGKYTGMQKLLPSIDNKNEVRDLLKESAEPDKMYYENRIVYFDSNYRDENLMEKLSYYKEIFWLCAKNLNKKVAVRCHPSDRIRKEIFKQIDEIEVCDDGITTESLCVSDICWDKCVVCTISSSVAQNMKMIYGYEPYLIVLGKLFQRKDILIEELRECYSDKHKILVPNSLEELRDGLINWNC